MLLWLLSLMVPYVNMDLAVNRPPPLSVAMFHRRGVTGEIRTCTLARTSEWDRNWERLLYVSKRRLFDSLLPFLIA